MIEYNSIRPGGRNPRYAGKIIKRVEYVIDYINLNDIPDDYSGNVKNHMMILEDYDKNPNKYAEHDTYDYCEQAYEIKVDIRRGRKEGKLFHPLAEKYSIIQLITAYKSMKKWGYMGGPHKGHLIEAGEMEDGKTYCFASHRMAVLKHLLKIGHPRATERIMVLKEVIYE